MTVRSTWYSGELRARPSVLVVSKLHDVAYALETGLQHSVNVRTERDASDLEEGDFAVVVIASTEPLKDLSVIRLHPELRTAPVVVFAPGQALMDHDWELLRATVVIDDVNAIETLFTHVLRLVKAYEDRSDPLATPR